MAVLGVTKDDFAATGLFRFSVVGSNFSVVLVMTGHRICNLWLEEVALQKLFLFVVVGFVSKQSNFTVLGSVLVNIILIITVWLDNFADLNGLEVD